MTTVAILSQKGGVGKTTVALGLASAAAAAGDRTLVVDLDPQASATWVLGLDPAESLDTLGAVLAGDLPTRQAIVPSAWGEAVDVVPAGLGLAHYRPDVSDRRRAGQLRRALRSVTDDYDLVLVDCPPGIGDLTVTALAAADLAVIVVEPAALSLNTLEAVADLVDDVWHRFNDGLDLGGVIVNRVPAISREAERQYDELGRVVGRRAVWKPSIAQRTIVNEALGDRRPIHTYGSRARSTIETFDKLYAKLRRATRRT